MQCLPGVLMQWKCLNRMKDVVILHLIGSCIINSLISDLIMSLYCTQQAIVKIQLDDSFT